MRICVVVFVVIVLVEIVVAVTSDSPDSLHKDFTPMITFQICKLLCLLLVVVVFEDLQVYLFFWISKVPATSSRATH